MDTPIEEWRKSTLDGDLEVSSLGRVRTLAGRLLSQRTDGKGYLFVTRWRKRAGGGRSKKYWSVHRLVAHEFIGPLPPGLQTRHVDTNAANNAAANLAYGTQQDNHFDGVRAGKVLCKLDEQKVRDIRHRHKMGLSMARLAREYKVSIGTIKAVVTRQNWTWVL
jgi:hypothetical protein